VIGFSGRDPRTARAPGAENASQEGASFFPLARCCIRCTPGTGGAGNNAACLGGGSRLWTWWRFRRRGHHAAVFRPTQAGARVFRVNGLGLAAVKLRPSRVEGALREPNRFRVPWHIGAVRQRGPKTKLTGHQRCEAISWPAIEARDRTLLRRYPAPAVGYQHLVRAGS
jgi:hypothetical protein